MALSAKDLPEHQRNLTKVLITEEQLVATHTVIDTLFICQTLIPGQWYMSYHKEMCVHGSYLMVYCLKLGWVEDFTLKGDSFVLKKPYPQRSRIQA